MDDLSLQNRLVANKFKKINITNVNLTSMGNSISSGYSMLRQIKPLFYYNENIEEDMKNKNINLKTYNFARAEDNCDAKTYKMIKNNISLSEINSLNWIDYAGNHLPIIKNKRGEYVGITEEDKKKYFPKTLSDDIRINDVIVPSKEVSNIIIYNGGTGSLLDNLSREGCHISTYGITKDLQAIDAIMHDISILNSKDLNNIPTQVYLCGAPKYFLPVTELINSKLKTIAKRYAHVSYVEPTKAPVIQKNINNELGFDFHYDKKGYHILNLNIMNKIKEDYIVNRSVIRTSAKLKEESERAFYQTFNDRKDSTIERRNKFINIFEEEIVTLSELNENVGLYLSKLKEDVKENKPHDYYDLLKGTNSTRIIESMQKKLKNN